MSEKRYTPKEAALAVLNKAKELYEASNLAKAEDPLNSIAGDRVKRAAGYKAQGDSTSEHIAREGAMDAHKERLEGIKTSTKPNLDKSSENPDEKADAQLGEQVENAVHTHEAQNEHPEQHEEGMKGHIKLAKFVGRMELKKSQKAKPQG